MTACRFDSSFESLVVRQGRCNVKTSFSDVITEDIVTRQEFSYFFLVCMDVVTTKEPKPRIGKQLPSACA